MEADLGINRGVADAVDGIFGRVLDGQDVALASVELFQGGRERGRLARASRAGNQADAVGFCERIAQYAVALAGQAEDVATAPRAVFVEDAHHDAFAGAARPRRDADVARLDPLPPRAAVVLRHPALGDLHARPHLAPPDHPPIASAACKE